MQALQKDVGLKTLKNLFNWADCLQYQLYEKTIFRFKSQTNLIWIWVLKKTLAIKNIWSFWFKCYSESILKKKAFKVDCAFSEMATSAYLDTLRWTITIIAIKMLEDCFIGTADHHCDNFCSFLKLK